MSIIENCEGAGYIYDSVSDSAWPAHEENGLCDVDESMWPDMWLAAGVVYTIDPWLCEAPDPGATPAMCGNPCLDVEQAAESMGLAPADAAVWWANATSAECIG